MPVYNNWAALVWFIGTAPIYGLHECWQPVSQDSFKESTHLFNLDIFLNFIYCILSLPMKNGTWRGIEPQQNNKKEKTI